MSDTSLEKKLFQQSKLGMLELGLTFVIDKTVDRPITRIDPDLKVLSEPMDSPDTPTLAKAVHKAAWHAHNISEGRDTTPEQYEDKKAILEFRLEEFVSDTEEAARKASKQQPEMKQPAETALAYVKALASIAVAREEVGFGEQLRKFMDDPFQGYKGGLEI